MKWDLLGVSWGAPGGLPLRGLLGVSRESPGVPGGVLADPPPAGDPPTRRIPPGWSPGSTPRIEGISSCPPRPYLTSKPWVHVFGSLCDPPRPFQTSKRLADVFHPFSEPGPSGIVTNGLLLEALPSPLCSPSLMSETHVRHPNSEFKDV